MQDFNGSVHESWSRAVLAATSVEEHAKELVGRLSDLTPEGARRLVGKVTERLQEHRIQLAEQVDGAVRAGLGRLRVPSRADLKSLEDKVSVLEARLERLEVREKSKG